MTKKQREKIEKEFNDKYKETRVIISSTHTSHISDVDEEIRFNKKDILNFIFQTYDELLADKRKEVKKQLKAQIKGSKDNMEYQRDITENYANTKFWDGVIFGGEISLDKVLKILE